MKKSLFVSAAITSLVICSCANAPKVQPTSFETLTIQKDSTVLPMFFSAVVEGKADVSIVPQTSGQLMSVDVFVGQKVKKGQVMFRIDDRQAKNNVNLRKAELIASEAQLETARLEYESNKNLFEKDIVSEYMLNTAYNSYQIAKAQVALAKEAVEQAAVDLEFCTITSPIDGLVGNITNNPGDLVHQMMALTTVSGTDQIKVKFSITENALNNILSQGMSLSDIITTAPPVRLMLKNGTEYAHKGKLANASGQIDRQTGSITIEAYFPNPDGGLYSGMQGNLVMDYKAYDVIIVPLTAVTRIQDKTLVYKVVDNMAKSVVVELQEGVGDSYAAVISGLEPGDVIVKAGVNNIYDGMQVIFPKENKPEK